jgi:hypothetical protein
MWAAAVVIPLAAMALPIVLILLAVLFDAVFLGWWMFRMWHDEWAQRIGEMVLRPLRSLWHLRPVPGSR